MPFKLFKKRNNRKKWTALEIALKQYIKSSEETEHIFFSNIVVSNLVALTKNHKVFGTNNLYEDTEFNLLTFGNGVVPIFTSVDRIYDNNVTKNDVQYIETSGTKLLEAIKDFGAILNPYSTEYLELTSKGIQEILNFKESTSIPTRSLCEFLEETSNFFYGVSHVNRAFFLKIESENQEKYLLAIDGELSKINLNELRAISQKYFYDGVLLDMFLLKQDQLSFTISNNREPFFTKH